MSPNGTERNDTHGGAAPAWHVQDSTKGLEWNPNGTERYTRGGRPCLARPGLHNGREWNPNDTRGAEPAWHVQDFTKGHEWNPNDTRGADPAWHVQDFTKGHTNGTRTERDGT
jgi:hypothetical protein